MLSELLLRFKLINKSFILFLFCDQGFSDSCFTGSAFEATEFEFSIGNKLLAAMYLRIKKKKRLNLLSWCFAYLFSQLKIFNTCFS
ncbi:hypothetical protein POUND7_000960 [Theobroma cacao]